MKNVSMIMEFINANGKITNTALYTGVLFGEHIYAKLSEDFIDFDEYIKVEVSNTEDVTYRVDSCWDVPHLFIQVEVENGIENDSRIQLLTRDQLSSEIADAIDEAIAEENASIEARVARYLNKVAC